MATTRIGLIGFSQGFYTTTYTRYLAKLKEVDVVACCDLGRSSAYVRECAFTTAEEFCNEIGAAHVRTLPKLFEKGVDAVIVTSEVSEHAGHTVQALNHGCHVFVGKPLSFRSGEVESVIEAANGKKQIVLCGNPLRYEEGLLELKQRLHRRAIGDMVSIRLLISHAAMTEQEWERDPDRSGGPLGTYGVYLFNLLEWLSEAKVEHLFAEGGTFVYEQLNSNDTVQAGGRLSSGALFQLSLISTVTWDFPFVILDIVGTEGTIRSNYASHTYLLQSQEREELGSIRYSSMGSAEMDHFVDCCTARDKPRVTPEQMLRVTRAIEAVEASLARGKKVTVPV